MKDRYQTIWPNADKDQALAYGQGLLEILANAPAFAGVLSVLEEHVHPDVRKQVRELTDAKCEAEYLASRRLKHLRTSQKMKNTASAQFAVVPVPEVETGAAVVAPVVTRAPMVHTTDGRWPFPTSTRPKLVPSGRPIINPDVDVVEQLQLLEARDEWFTKINRSQDRQTIDHAYAEIRKIHQRLYPGHP